MVENDEYLRHIPTAYRIMRSNQDKSPSVILNILRVEFSDQSNDWIIGLIDTIRKAMEQHEHQ